jgi:hypothetical protein
MSKGAEGMKQKPLLVYLSRHEIHPGVAADLATYEIRHIDRRFYSPEHAIEMIELVCGDRPPLVVIATLPQAWIVPFIQAVREKWATPGVTVARAVMFGDEWRGYFVRRTTTKNGELREHGWTPQGCDRDRQQRARIHAHLEDTAALVKRLEDL